MALVPLQRKKCTQQRERECIREEKERERERERER